MRSRIRRTQTFGRSRRLVGMSVFANLALLGAVAMLLAASGDQAAAEGFVAGPLEDTWDYLADVLDFLCWE